MDQNQIARELSRIATELERLKDWDAVIAKTYANKIRSLAREVEQFPEPGRMRDVVKRGMKW
jgi:phage host-nuclease inhibitor protein Gam